MPRGMTEGFYRDALTSWALENGWRPHRSAIGRERGPDLVFRGARKSNRSHRFIIEIKRSEKGDPFIPALGQIVTRMVNIGNYAYHYAIALPDSVARRVIENRRLKKKVAQKLRLSILGVSPNGNVNWYTFR